MSAKILTAEQRAAVEAEGETLVSASAGSGKTFVMIEKIISLILEGKAQISGVLAVTFTNLAAAEMKEKLKRAIVGRINEETDEGVKSRLKYELSEIGASDICTLHSFCANLIRRYFYVTDENGDTEWVSLSDRQLPAEWELGVGEERTGILLYAVPEASSEYSIAFMEIFEPEGDTDDGEYGDVFFVYFSADETK